VRHEVEAGHEKHHVDEEEPVALEGYFAFLDEDSGGVRRCFADALAFLVGLRFGEAEAEGNYQDRGPGAEPEELCEINVNLCVWWEGVEGLTGRQP